MVTENVTSLHTDMKSKNSEHRSHNEEAKIVITINRLYVTD